MSLTLRLSIENKEHGHDDLTKKWDRMATFSPLLEVAMSWIAEDQVNGVTPQGELFIRSVIARFCDNNLSVDEFRSALCPFLTSSRSIDRLYIILHCQTVPFPSYPEPSARGDHSKRRAKPWSIAEDNRLLYAIHQHGLQAWPAVAAFVGNNRSRAQCAQRWTRVLDPRICKDDWTQADDLRLVQLVTLRGEAGWTWISRELGNRSDVQCRYRYLQLKNSGREAALLAQLPAVVVPTHVALGSEFVQRQLARLMTRKKGRPMKTQLPHGFGQKVIPMRPTPVTPSQPPVVEDGLRVAGTANQEPLELFIDWTRDRHDEALEVMSW
jgi:hypothetical protein